MGADGTTNPCHYIVAIYWRCNVVTWICGSIRPYCYENFEKPKKILTIYLSKNYSGTRFAYTTMKYVLFLRTYFSCHGQGYVVLSFYEDLSKVCHCPLN